MTHSVKIKQILKTSESWSGSPLPGFNSGVTEFKVMHYTIPPGGKTTIHVHPLNGAGYMLSGELTMFSTEDPHGSFENPKQVRKIKLKAGMLGQNRSISGIMVKTEERTWCNLSSYLQGR